jgi:hypothetical protein
MRRSAAKSAGIVAVVVSVALAAEGAFSARARQTNQAAKTSEAQADANPKDVESVDAILAALYEVISGPAGERDWNRFRSLFIPEGRLMAVRVSKEGKISYAMMSVEDYVSHAGAYFREHAFYESEISRKTERFGQMAHVYSTYASRAAKDAAPFERGINSIELFNDGKRWWCVSIYWDAERTGNAIPQKYLPE